MPGRIHLRAMFVATIITLAAQAQPPTSHAISADRTQELLDRINEMRIEAGVDVLAPDTSLGAVAEERSDDMATRHYFSHTTPDGTDLFELLDERGIPFSIAGENLAWS